MIMKKINLASALRFFLFPFLLFVLIAETNAQPLKFSENNIGIGIGVPAITNYEYTSLNPAITATFEHGFSDKIGIGYIAGGALLSFSGSKDVYYISNTKYTDKYSYFSIGPKASYHFDMADITGDKFWNKVDLYAGVFMGLRFQTYKYYAAKGTTSYTEYEDKTTHLASDIYAGIRYAFNDKFGVYAETGYGVSYFTVGISWRF